MIVQVFRFCPFSSRPGDAVLGLRFGYHEETALALKVALAEQRAAMIDPNRNVRHAGGWLPLARCWFVELQAWPAVKVALLDHDHATCFEVVECPAEIVQYPAHGTGAP